MDSTFNCKSNCQTHLVAIFNQAEENSGTATILTPRALDVCASQWNFNVIAEIGVSVPVADFPPADVMS